MKKTKPFITGQQDIRGINRKFLPPMILAFVFILTASFFSTVTAGQEPLSIKVGAYANHPKIFMDADGKVSGFWPNLIEHIAKTENWKIEYIWGTWREGLDHLINKEIAIMPDVAFTEKRNKLYTFSEAHVLMSWTRVYVNKGKTEIQSICDLKNRKIAALKGSVNLEGSGGLRESALGFNLNCTFLELDNYTEVFKAVEENRVDAGITNRNFGNKNAKNFKVKKTPIIFQPVNMKFAFPKNAELTPHLAERINYHIKKLKQDEHSVYYQLLEKYFEAEIAEKTVEVFPVWLSTVLKSITALFIFFILVIIASRIQVKRKTNEIIVKNKALQISEQRYRGLFEDSPISLWEEDFSDIKKHIDRLRDSGITDFRSYFKDHPEAVRKCTKMAKIIDINKVTLEMFQAESKKELLENLTLVFRKESYEVFQEELITLAEGKNNFKAETVNKTLQGNEIYVSLLLSVVPGFEDSWSKVIITLSDITEQVRAKHILQEREEMFGSIFNQSPIGTELYDTEGSLVDANPKCLEIFGVQNVEAVRGFKLFEDPNISDEFKKRIRAGEPVSYESEFNFDKVRELDLYETSKTGKLFLKLFITPCKTRGYEQNEFLVHIIDITERKQSEKQLHRANRALKTFSECNQAVVRARKEPHLLHEICRIIVDIGGYRLAWVGFVRQDEAKTVQPVAQAGYEEGYLDKLNITWADTERGRGPTGTAIRAVKPIVVKNILNDPNFTPWRAEASKRGYESAIALPLISDDQAFGTLNIYAKEPDAFDAEEIKLLMELTDDLAYGIIALRTLSAHKQAEEELKKHRERLEELVKDRTTELKEKVVELERMNDLFVGREFRIKELRNRVKELELKIDY